MQPNYNKNKGLTVIELIIVVVIIGILAVTAGPAFFGRQGIDEFLFQTRLEGVLRLQQQKAMQDTTNCYAVIIDGNRFAATDDCDAVAIQDPLANRGQGISLTEANDAKLAISSTAAVLPYLIKFNGLGCPIEAPNDCDTAVNHQLTIVGNSTLYVCVNSQGYIAKGICL